MNVGKRMEVKNTGGIILVEEIALWSDRSLDCSQYLSTPYHANGTVVVVHHVDPVDAGVDEGSYG